jgi:nitric oxide reductase subunit B
MGLRGNTMIGLRFMRLGILSLGVGLFFGVIGGFQYLFPDFIRELLFTKTRALHVSMVVSWIFLIAIGGIYYYLPKYTGKKLHSNKLAVWHYWLFLITGICVLFSYLSGKFGGREYFAFPPILSIPIFVSWILFGFNYFKTMSNEKNSWPVYYWQWATGIVFFFLTYTEAHLYLIPYFRENMVREIIVQWKSYGALTGSWNMLVYGTALFIATRIGGSENIAKSKMAFGLYFLGLFNLIFGWAHHTYLVPSETWIRTFAYFVSMTELYIFGKIIWDWRGSLEQWEINRHITAYRFLFAADIWVFLNLGLALIISVPIFNLYTHGTHIIVAHAMGSTIGINTMVLLSSIFFIINESKESQLSKNQTKKVIHGFWIANISLAIFLVALILAGIGKGLLYTDMPFQAMMFNIRPFLVVFTLAGITLMLGLWIVLWRAYQSIGVLYSSLEDISEQDSLKEGLS